MKSRPLHCFLSAVPTRQCTSALEPWRRSACSPAVQSPYFIKERKSTVLITAIISGVCESATLRSSPCSESYKLLHNMILRTAIESPYTHNGYKCQYSATILLGVPDHDFATIRRISTKAAEQSPEQNPSGSHHQYSNIPH
jgi:hypothetical protein